MRHKLCQTRFDRHAPARDVETVILVSTSPRLRYWPDNYYIATGMARGKIESCTIATSHHLPSHPPLPTTRYMHVPYQGFFRIKPDRPVDDNNKLYSRL